MSQSGEVTEQQERSLSGAIFSVDVPYWKKNNKRDGSAYSGYNASVIHIYPDIFPYSHAFKRDSTIGRRLFLKVMAIFTCTKYESALLQTVWSIPTAAGPTSK